MSDARETIAMRNRIQAHLTPSELRAVNWRTIQDVAVNAVARGWTGEELALWALGDIGPDTDNIPASIYTTIKNLGGTSPPRPAETPTPEHILDLRARLNPRREPAAENATAWVQRIRSGLTYTDATPADDE